MLVYAIVPVNKIERAKKRLSGEITQDEKKELLFCLVRDVLASLSKIKNKLRILLISPDNLKEIADEYGAEFVLEDDRDDVNYSVKYANFCAKKKKADATLFLPADMPLVKSEDIEEVLELGKKHSIVISRTDDNGTGILFRRPPDIIPTFFGKNSFSAHKEYAEKKGVSMAVIYRESLSFDIDEREDLYNKEMFKKFGRDKLTYKFVKKLWEKYDIRKK